jgi:hypothetical protein
MNLIKQKQNEYHGLGRKLVQKNNLELFTPNRKLNSSLIDRDMGKLQPYGFKFFILPLFIC